MKEDYLKYSNENKLAKKILGEEDFKRLDKMFKWLKYDCIGEYIYYEAIEWVGVLQRHSNYQKTTYYKKYNDFINPTIPRFRIYRWFIMENHFPRLLFDLRKGLVEELFRLERNFETLVNFYNDFRFFISSVGPKAIQYQKFLVLGEALLEKKRQEVERQSALVSSNTELMSIDNDKFSEKIKIPLSNDFIVPFPTRSPELLSEFRDFLIKLETLGLISSVDQFLSPFIIPGNRIYSKVVWNGELLTLIFMLEYVMFRQIIHRKSDIAKRISVFFATVELENLNSKTISNYSANMGFSEKDVDKKKFKIREYIAKSENSELLLVNDEIQRYLY